MLADELERIKDNIEGLRASIQSLIASHNSNNVLVMQKLTGTESWQDAHERLDDERWKTLDIRLASLTAVIQAIPVEVGVDLGKLEMRVDTNDEKIEKHEEALQQMKGAWRVLAVGGGLVGVVIGVVEFLAHWKGG